MSTLSDDELDAVIGHILEVFPAFGRRMIAGHLRHLGHSVPRARIRLSYERVTGSPAFLTARPIERWRYHVAGPNSLWHHDGQHGMVLIFLFSVFTNWGDKFSAHPVESSHSCLCGWFLAPCDCSSGK
ncbi:hypothetical protein BDP27DRAFT_668555 [Rhodocollybia butyracea]|uniref:Uncharacterized protein n=1 Tax=Rhodocollybia butyracea TaxID=206335 RepID=A0A9P5TVX3_9AGAR|nr:hypothetical protein BDP27DRAFT_668555 [Rhodocollybia butyracea]